MMKTEKKELRTLSKDDNLIRNQRKAITEAALKVFERKNYHDATIQEIADAAGFSLGNIYRYIGSKEDILHLICHDAELLMKDGGEDITVRCETVTETLKQTIIAFVKRSEPQAKKHLFYDREIRNFSHADRAMLLESQVKIIDIFEKIIREGIDKGEFKTKDPLLVAHNIGILQHDWALRRWFLIKHYSIDEFAENQADIILKSLVNHA
jgi:AcrR family transcriptional regulator